MNVGEDDADLVEALDNLDSNDLSDWESEFIVSVYEQVMVNDRPLTARQRDKAEEILEDKD